MVYYGLLRTNILVKDYKSAKENLNIESEYNIDDTFFYEKLKSDNLLLYLNGIKLILENNYSKAIQIFNKLELKVKEEKICISFKYIIELINNLTIKKDLTNEYFNEQIELLKDHTWNNDSEKIENIVNKLLDSKLNKEQKAI